MDFTECYGDTCSAVALAAREGKGRRVQKLIQRGFAVDVKDNRGWNALHESAAAGSAECVRLLLTAAGKSLLSQARLKCQLGLFTQTI